MEITIEWTEQSKQQLRDIFVYYTTEAGLAVADQIVDRMRYWRYLIAGKIRKNCQSETQF